WVPLAPARWAKRESMGISTTTFGIASATPSCCPWSVTSAPGQPIRVSPAATTSVSTTPAKAVRKSSPRSWKSRSTSPQPFTRIKVRASASWWPATWISAMSMTSNPSTEPRPFDRAIAVNTFLRPLAAHLDDAAVTEIAIVRPGECYSRVRGAWMLHECPALTYPHLEALATALAAYNHMAKAPILSVVLPGGERGQIVQPPACIDGTLAVNIRKHAQAAFTLETLQAQGAFDAVDDAAARAAAGGMSPIDQNLLKLKASG